MKLREIIKERILYAVTEEELAEEFYITGNDIDQLSDIDLFELYEDVVFWVAS